LPASFGCPKARFPGTKVLVSSPLVNVLRETSDIAPPDQLLPRRSALLSLYLVELGQRTVKYIIEEPHRIENFAHRCGRLCAVSFTEGEHAVIAQVSHDSRFGNPVISQVTGIERGLGRTWNDLDQFEESHLIDWVRQSFHDRRYAREQIRVRVHQAVPHSGPVIVSRI